MAIDKQKNDRCAGRLFSAFEMSGLLAQGQ
jgi:hypothetical protein